MKENDAIQFLGGMSDTLKAWKIVAVCCCVISIVVPLGSLYFANKKIDEVQEHIYILEQGSILAATRADNNAQKDLEVMDHVTRFHELFFNIAPNINTINLNIGRALELADESAYDYYTDLKENRYFSQLIGINATQQITVDSIHVDVMRYPYSVETFSSLYILRNSNVSKYTLKTQCEVTEVTRTETNPHGLLIGDFYADKAVLVETRQRNN